MQLFGIPPSSTSEMIYIKQLVSNLMKIIFRGNKVSMTPKDLGIRGDRIKTLIALSEPYQRCSRSSDRIRNIDSGLVVYQRLFPFSRSE